MSYKDKTLYYNISVHGDGHCGYYAILHELIRKDIDVKNVFKLRKDPILLNDNPIQYDAETIQDFRDNVYNRIIQDTENRYSNPFNNSGELPMEAIKGTAYMHDSVIQLITDVTNVCIVVYDANNRKDYRWSTYSPYLSDEESCAKYIYIARPKNELHFNILIPRSEYDSSSVNKPSTKPPANKPSAKPPAKKNTTKKEKTPANEPSAKKEKPSAKPPAKKEKPSAKPPAKKEKNASE